MTAAVMESALGTLRDLVRGTEPGASVYVGGASLPPADTTGDRLLRQRAVAAELRRQGADTATVSAVEDHLRHLPYPIETAVFATAGAVRWALPLPGANLRDSAWFGTPPTVTPVLAWLQRHPAYVIVLIDRAGADLTTVRAGAVEGTTRSISGPDDEIERNAPGGWAQARYQRRAEDSWLHNATAVAAAVAEELAAVRTDLVIMGGDVRACQLLTDRLTRTGIPPHIRQIPGGRSPDGSATRRSEAVAAIVDAYAAAQQQGLLQRFAAASGLPRTAVAGAEETLSALTAGQVETLLVVDQPGDDRQAWFTATGWCGAAPGEPRPPDAIHGRLVDIAVRSALLSQARIQVVDESSVVDLPDGIGAICRFR